MKLGYIIAILFLAVACQNVKYPEKPDNLIPQDKMVDVLTEVYLSNAVRSNNIRLVRDSGYKLDSMLYNKFSIDSMQFAKSHAFYSSNLDDYTLMFEKVKANLEVMKVKADTLLARYTERRRVLDSIKRDSLRMIETKRLEDSIKKTQPHLTPVIETVLTKNEL